MLLATLSPDIKRKSFLKNIFFVQADKQELDYYLYLCNWNLFLYEETTYINIPFCDAYGIRLSFHKL